MDTSLLACYDALMPALPPSFMSKVRKSTNGCWHWTGEIVENGYGRYSVAASKALGREARNWPAHRYAYEHVNGPLPRKGELGHVQVDHECHNRSKSCKGGPTCLHRRCVNPAHLTAKTPRANGESSQHSTASINRAKTHCLRGHELTGDNLRERAGKRYCYTCHLASTNEARRERLAAQRPEGWERRYWQRERDCCPQGHPYDYTKPNGGRGCRTCRAAAAARSRAKAKAR